MAKKSKGSDAVFTPPSIADLGAGSHLSDAAKAFIEESQGQVREETFGLPIIRIDHRAEAFRLPSGELVPVIEGYPIHKFQRRAYWKGAYRSGDTTPPTCFSNDMIRPDPNSDEKQAQTCMRCPQAAWGSDALEKGQACRTSLFVFLLNPSFGNPPIACLVLPPSSLKTWEGSQSGFGAQGVFRQAASAYGAYQVAWIEVGLERGGDIHCNTVPRIKGVAPAEEARILARIRGVHQQAMESYRSNVAALPAPAEDEPVVE